MSGFAREGLPLVGASGVVTLATGAVALATGGGAWMAASVATLVLTLFLLYFFRDPERESLVGSEYVLSAADGRVVQVVEEEGGDDLGAHTRVSVFLSIFNVHVNRIPADGVVGGVEYKSGRFVAAFKKAASRLNEQTRIEIESSTGRLVVSQIAGLIARRIVYRIVEGQQVKRGERFGIIRFGSRVDVLLPPSVRVLVKKGDSVKGGITPIGVRKDAA